MNARVKKYFFDRNRTSQKKYFFTEGFLIKRSSSLPWIELKGLKAPATEIFNEFLSVRKKIKFYRHDRGNLNKGWLAHTLYGYGENKTLSYLEYRNTTLKRHWSQSIKSLPKTHAFIKSLPYKQLYDIRFLMLKPGGYIHPHTDTQVMCLDPLNIAIHFPKNCFFKFEKFGYLPIKTGKGFVINIGYEHSVLNLSKESRLHLVIHGRKDPEFYKRLM